MPNWNRIQVVCGYLTAGAAVIIPVVVWFLRGLSEAANAAQVVSIPLVAVSLGLAYWLTHNPAASRTLPSPRRRAQGWAIVVVCFLCSALAIGAASTGRTVASVSIPAELPGLGIPATSAEQDPQPSKQRAESHSGQSGDTATRSQPNSGPAQPGQLQPGEAQSGETQSGEAQPGVWNSRQPPSRQDGTEQPGPRRGEPGQPHPVVLAEQPVELSTQAGQESVEIDSWRHVTNQSADLLMAQDGIHTARGARLSVVSEAAEPSYDHCAQLETWTDQIDFTDLQAGSQLCARSSEGRYAMFQILHVPSAPENDMRFIFFGRTWELTS